MNGIPIMRDAASAAERSRPEPRGSLRSHCRSSPATEASESANEHEESRLVAHDRDVSLAG